MDLLRRITRCIEGTHDGAGTGTSDDLGGADLPHRGTLSAEVGKALDAAATEGEPQLVGAGGAVVCHWLSHLLA